MVKNGAESITALRRFYAQLVAGRWGVENPRIREAFEKVRREDFVGTGPWKVPVAGSYVETPTADPAVLYQNILIALNPEKGIHNGEPSLHARCIGEVAPEPGEHVLHVGCGTGYYTAIMADMVGPTGRVDAFEVEADLAETATRVLADRTNVTVHSRSATENLPSSCDVVYVNAGASRPLDAWLDALAVGGRLLVPLVKSNGQGCFFLITRTDQGFAARFVWFIWIIGCVGGFVDGDEQAISDALEKNARGVGSLIRSDKPDETCWYSWSTGWLSTREP